MVQNNYQLSPTSS